MEVRAGVGSSFHHGGSWDGTHVLRLEQQVLFPVEPVEPSPHEPVEPSPHEPVEQSP